MASSATVSAPKKRKSFSEYFHSMRGQQLIVTLVFLFVPLVLLFMFTYLPFFKMVEFSFFKMKYIGRRTFVGLQNYISVFTRKDCFHALSLSLYYMVGSVVQMALALRVAPLLGLPPTTYRAFLMASSTAWMAVFVLYLWKYVPILIAPRVDGRPG